MSSWLAAANFQATTLSNDDPVTVQWHAVRGETLLYGFWRAAR
ncbi:hypothetical protein [Deinococcus xinjiangensis]